MIEIDLIIGRLWMGGENLVYGDLTLFEKGKENL